ncbi:possible transposase [Nitrobacter winogradskyi Nb-255]|uniref:Possible transposase n=1 Tax=Nitrobacter winogradskyi (strain ATCC 25391 / DSM 10237 / CIP 104748 / NCIMB 11846 / Nb-255) TaxID=323098 RepID=Q3SWC6_NITWN|nr:IS1595-like element ISNwi4 family transposase [Nitrobacter winogradskyi]ABA03415.1 possible transposase [Nitrobacter winogradskyi Nb-255]
MRSTENVGLMSQHFLLSAKARTLSLAKVARLSDDEAYDAFRLIRWAATDGAPVCPRCECAAVYTYTTRRLFKCKACSHQFSVTSDTIFASRKLPVRDYLLAIAIFVNGAKGHSALQLSRDLDCQYKTAFVMAHKIREALASEAHGAIASGEVEVDGAYFGGYVKPANHKGNRRDRRRIINQNGKRRVVVIMRERGGRTLPFVFKSEDASLVKIAQTVAPGSVIHADEATHWDALHARFLTKRINHSESYSDGDACTNQAESFFSRMRRAEIGVHHRIAGDYLSAYAGEMAWRENNRRISNGEQYLMVADAALQHPVSRQWKGYWQRNS